METYDKLQKKPSSPPQRNSRHNKKSDNDKETKIKQKQQQPRGILRRRKKEESVYSKLHVSSPNTSSNQNKKNNTIKSSLKKSSKNESASTLRNIESKTHEKHQTAFSTKHHLPKPPSSSSVHHSTPQYQRRMHSQQSRGVDRVDSRSEQNKDKQDVLPSYQQTRSDEVNRKIRKDKKWTKLVKESVHIETNNVSKYQDTNKIAKTLHQMGLQDESQHFKRLIRKRFQLEEDFIKLNDQVGIQTIEGDYDECATPTHSSVGGLKIQKVPKSFIMVDEYDPKILIKNLNVLKDLEKRTIAIHRICLENQTK